jgi:TP901 family phage tail tape measure protein
MASKPVKITITGDTTNFKKSLDEADKKLGGFAASVGKSGLAIAAGLVAAGVGAGVGLFKLGETFDKSFDQIRIGTGATGKALEALKEDFKSVAGNVPSDMGDVSTAIADINTRLGLTGQPLQALSTQFLELSRVTGGKVSNSIDKITRTFGDWNIATEDQSLVMDQLFRASQNSGIAVDELAQSLVSFGAPLRNVGFSLQESQALLAVFNKTGVNTETVIAGLKAGVGKLAKAGEDVPTTFRRVVDEITKLGPGTESTALAIQLFGQRAGPDLADAIAGGKFELESMLDAIVNGEDTIAKAAKDTESFGEKWNTLKNKVFVLLEPAATKVFDTIGKAIDAVIPYVDKFAEFIGPVINDAIRTSAPAVQRIRKAIVSFIETAEPKVRQIISTVRDFTIRFKSAGDDTTSTAGKLRETVNKLFVAFREAFGAIVEIVRFGLKTASWLWESFGENILSFLRKSLERILAVFSGLLDMATGIFKLIRAVLTGEWGAAWEAMKQILSGAWTVIKELVKTLWHTLGLAFHLGKDAIVATMRLAWNQTISAVASGVESVIRWVGGLPGRATAALGNLGSALVGAGASLIQGLWNGIESRWDSVRSWFASIPGSIRTLLSGASNWLWNIGRDVLNGLIDGIQSRINALTDKVKSVSNVVTNTVKNTLGIRSPSTVMFGFGKNAIEGFNQGLQSKPGREQAQAIQAAATTSSGGGDTINIYGSNLTATDVARELAWRRRIGSGR